MKIWGQVPDLHGVGIRVVFTSAWRRPINPALVRLVSQQLAQVHADHGVLTVRAASCRDWGTGAGARGVGIKVGAGRAGEKWKKNGWVRGEVLG